MPKHQSKLENFTIHFLAFLFLFSTISSAFLIYSSQQPKQTDLITLATPVQAAISNYDWVQTNWSGGESSSVYTIGWGTTGGWTKYTTSSGVSFGTTGFTINNGGNIVSSIFNTGSKRAQIAHPDIDDYYPYPVQKIRGGNSPTEVNNAPWSGMETFCNWVNFPYVQYSLENNTGSPITIDQVSFWAGVYDLHGLIKDSTTNNGISGANVDYGIGSTISTTNNSYNYILVLDFVPLQTLNFTVSKTGYTSQTKSLSMSTDGCNAESDLDFSLVQASSNPPAAQSPSSQPPSSTTTTQSVTQGPPVSLTVLQNTVLPALFTAPGSTTTDLSKVTDNTSVSNFTLDIPGSSKIVFKEPVDLSGQKTVDYLKTLGEYVKIGTSGTVELDSTILNTLNKPATITMYSLNYVSPPEILVDGKKDTSGVISNIQFDQQTSTLTFDVTHFTVFSAAPKLEILFPTSKTPVKLNMAIQGRISDPKAVVTGSFNGIKLNNITPNKETGVFTINKLSYNNGNNVLKLEATSTLGTIAPLTQTFVYGTSNKVTNKTSSYNNIWILISLGIALLTVAGIGLLSIRIRKRKEKAAKETSSQIPVTSSRADQNPH